MEIVIIAVVAVVAIGWWIWKEGKHEANGHPLESFTQKLDVNNDGKVDVQDAVAAAEVVVEKTKKVAAKTKAVAKAAATKVKAPAKKAPAKKTAVAKKTKAK